jgi:DNA-binding beta-propeller fold protein YncE
VSEFKHPLGVAVSPIDGSIFVADSWNNRLQVFDESGVFKRCVDKIGQIEFHYPYSIHVDEKGRIYVSDQSLIRIKVFDSNFNLIRVIGRYGREVGCYSGLCDISTDADHNIYVCDSGNHRILKFNENGEFLSQWGSNGTSEGLFKCPACVTVHENFVLVSDWGMSEFLFSKLNFFISVSFNFN